jgi:hypothetical protein
MGLCVVDCGKRRIWDCFFSGMHFVAFDSIQLLNRVDDRLWSSFWASEYQWRAYWIVIQYKSAWLTGRYARDERDCTGQGGSWGEE